MNITDWLPMLPWEGPPLPRFLNIVWPFAQTSGSLSLPSPRYISDTSEDINETRAPTSLAVTTYDNTETVEFPDGFDPDTFMPRKIVIHRSAKVSQ